MKKLERIKLSTLSSEVNVLGKSESANIIGGQYTGSDGNTYYTGSEMETMMDNGTWTGGFVNGMGYMGSVVDVSPSDGDYYSGVSDVDFYGYDSSDSSGCLNRCREMMNSAGYDIADVNDSGNVQMTQYDSNGNLAVQNGADEGINLINNTLSAGKPIVVGTDYKSGHSGNYDKTTDHWIVLVGHGVDDNGEYYTYYDSQTSHESIGTGSDNKLYIQNNGALQGTYRSGSSYERTYSVTMVRQTNNRW